MAKPDTRLGVRLPWGRSRQDLNGAASPVLRPSGTGLGSLRGRGGGTARAHPAPGVQGQVLAVTTARQPIRVLLVEDVPRVAEYVRELLGAQPLISLVDVVRDGRRVVRQVAELLPDVVIVDTLLQGRVGGLALIEQMRAAGLTLAVVALTVPQNVIADPTEHGIDRLLALPFGGYELVNALKAAVAAAAERAPGSSSRVAALYAAKGGVGKTTLAFNLAAALGRSGLRPALIDGNLQFGDLRTLLKAPAEAPSIMDVPTHTVQQSDIREVMWGDRSGVDVLFGPPRPELAEMVSARDLAKVISLLRRLYNAIVIDTPGTLDPVTLALLDAADVIYQVLTPDATTVQNALVGTDTLRAAGFPSAKIRLVANRIDTSGGLTLEQLKIALGREPEHTIASDWHLVVSSNDAGVPFVVRSPEARVSVDVLRMAESLATVELRSSASVRATH